jgi:hypothetical protein
MIQPRFQPRVSTWFQPWEPAPKKRVALKLKGRKITWANPTPIAPTRLTICPYFRDCKLLSAKII